LFCGKIKFEHLKLLLVNFVQKTKLTGIFQMLNL